VTTKPPIGRAVRLSGCVLSLAALSAGAPSTQAASPRGNLIAFTRVFAHRPQFRIFLVQTDGHGLRELRTGVTPSMEPSWSPDGRWIVFRGGARDDLYLVRADGSGLRRLTRDSAHEEQASWSPDATAIVYTRFATPGSSSAIWVLRLQTGKAARLTPDTLGAGSPSWSPDGSEIAFVSQTARHGYTPQLWVMRADGSHAHHIFPALDGASDPVWAPRGHRLLIAGQTKLYVMDPRRGDPRAIVALGASAAGEREEPSPQWSPDATKVVFCQLNRAGRSEIWIVDADGRSLRRLTTPPQGALLDDQPSWRP
jgi:Tol biopolymer transport system component